LVATIPESNNKPIISFFIKLSLVNYDYFCRIPPWHPIPTE